MLQYMYMYVYYCVALEICDLVKFPLCNQPIALFCSCCYSHFLKLTIILLNDSGTILDHSLKYNSALLYTHSILVIYPLQVPYDIADQSS